MPIDNIKNLAKPKDERGSRARGFTYPLLGNATLYKKPSSKTPDKLLDSGFSLEFDDEKSAQDFLSIMCNLSDKNGRLIFPNLSTQENNLVEIKTSVGAAIKKTFKVNIEANLNDELEEKIRSSNLAKSIERQKARQDSAAKGILATGFNIATLGFGVPVLGYASNAFGRTLAAANNKFGWVPGLGFVLRTGARAFLDASAGLLQHGRSILPSTAYNRKQARAIERISDDVDKAFPLGNEIPAFFTNLTGGILKIPAFFTNLVADGLTSIATKLETRKAEESKSTFYLRKFAANALKTLAFPFRVPEMLASWVLKSGEKALPTMHNAIDGVFKKSRFFRINKVSSKEEPVLPTKINPNLDALKVLANQEGLVFDQLYEKNKYALPGTKTETFYLAKLAKVEVNGRTYEVLGDYKTSQFFYKYSGGIFDSAPPEDLQKINAELEKIAANLPQTSSKISKNGFSEFKEGDAAWIKQTLGDAIKKTTRDNKNNASLLTYQDDEGQEFIFDINNSKAFSISVGPQVLTYEKGIFGFSSHKQDLKLTSREFFNFLGNLSKGKAVLTISDGMPKASPEKPKVIHLKSGKNPKDKEQSPGDMEI